MSQRSWLDVTIKAALIGGAVLMYLDLRAEMRSIRSEINSNRISLEDKIDRVETKIDEMRGYFKYDADAMTNDTTSADLEK